jgi:hypothetical protein
MKDLMKSYFLAHFCSTFFNEMKNSKNRCFLFSITPTSVASMSTTKASVTPTSVAAMASVTPSVAAAFQFKELN